MVEWNWATIVGWAWVAILLIRLVRMTRERDVHKKAADQYEEQAVVAIEEANKIFADLEATKEQYNNVRHLLDMEKNSKGRGKGGFSFVRLLVSDNTLFQALTHENTEAVGFGPDDLTIWYHPLSGHIVYLYRAFDGRARYMAYDMDQFADLGGIDHSARVSLSVKGSTPLRADIMRSRSVDAPRRSIEGSADTAGKVFIYEHMADMQRYYDERMVKQANPIGSPKRRIRLTDMS